MTDQVEAIMRLVEEYARSKPPLLNQDPKRAYYHEEVKAELRRSITELGSRHPQPQAVPEGWKLERDTGGGAIIINGPNYVGGCVAYREPVAGRMIPEAILFALADSLLSRHPLPQAVKEDARDGERLDWLGQHGTVILESIGGVYTVEFDQMMPDMGRVNLREAIDAARAATSGKGAE